MKKLFGSLGYMVLVLSCVHSAARAQDASYEAVLQPTKVVTKLPGDRVCPYFLLTNLGYLPSPAVTYSYIDGKGSSKSDVIDAGRGSVVIDVAMKTAPAVKKTTGADGGPRWIITIAGDDYGLNKECLGILPQK